MKEFIKKRLRNKYFWVSALAVVSTAVKMVNPNLIPEDFNNQVNTILIALISMGVLIDPSTPGISDGGDK
jgi:uncharacterized membrane protein